MIGIDEVSRNLEKVGRAHHGFALFDVLFLEEVGEVYGRKGVSER